jgi:hypothetical protein
MLVNDRPVSMERLLGNVGAMSLHAHTPLCGACARPASGMRGSWTLLDPSISYQERITRSAAMLFASAENRLKGPRLETSSEAPEGSGRLLVPAIGLVRPGCSCQPDGAGGPPESAR